ncbi:Protein of unknown function [Ferrimonas sediminum]|uniref:DUF3833 domain-containing protein n=1 Tax=Ferrimonas sediminum TaxID=718193 RepID=A0A1G8QAE8_9GAMM|nr:DUF3833 domain-containing protein [Ferrimonas sediminum]SDJ01671.1 Protein of unknown function [Ferrimonas sediminum]
MIRLLLIALLLVGCSQDLSPYRDWQPPMSLETFFDGEVMAYGMVTDRSGEVMRRFRVRIDGRWDGAQGTLDEYFFYADGDTQFRQWRIERLEDGSYRGRADDIIGVAQGRVGGAVLHWIYDMELSTDSGNWQVSFDDTMVMIDANHMLNRAKIKKFGITVAEVFLSFEKKAPPSATDF